MCRLIARAAGLLLFASSLHAYSVLTHEAIVDAAWDREIQPLLLRRYPESTPDALRHAHASAYAGSIIQDLGYYPFGNRFFSALLHYARTGAFLSNLLREARTLGEYAFALGALAHYAGDTQGHNVAVNRAVALQYPALATKFGPTVTYADDRISHIKVEFSFDVAQVARGNYAPQAYHDFIGFQVERALLERAFRATYSLELADVLADATLALATFRYAVAVSIPAVTHAAWHLRKDDLAKAQPPVSRRRFVYNLSRASYRKEWSGRYRAPGAGARILATLIRILPKFGPLHALSFPPPAPQTAALFEASFNRTLGVYRRLLADEAAGSLSVEERNLDTGAPTMAGDYRLADETYSRLARRLAALKGTAIEPALRQHILDFYRDPNRPVATRRSPKDWRRTLAALDALRAAPASE